MTKRESERRKELNIDKTQETASDESSRFQNKMLETPLWRTRAISPSFLTESSIFATLQSGQGISIFRLECIVGQRGNERKEKKKKKKRQNRRNLHFPRVKHLWNRQNATSRKIIINSPSNRDDRVDFPWKDLLFTRAERGASSLRWSFSLAALAAPEKWSRARSNYAPLSDSRFSWRVKKSLDHTVRI